MPCADILTTAIFLALQLKSAKAKGRSFAVVYAMQTRAYYRPLSQLLMLHLTGQRPSDVAELYLLRISALDHVTRMLVVFFALHVSSSGCMLTWRLLLQPHMQPEHLSCTYIA